MTVDAQLEMLRALERQLGMVLSFAPEMLRPMSEPDKSEFAREHPGAHAVVGDFEIKCLCLEKYGLKPDKEANLLSMSPERAKELLPCFHAYAEGKTIQSRMENDPGWTDCFEPAWVDHRQYRVKPEPREWWLTGDFQSGVTVASLYGAKPETVSAGHEAVHVRELLE